MKNTSIILFCILTISSHSLMQAKSPRKKIPKTVIKQKITKKSSAPEFIDCKFYADLQTFPLNRPGLETKKDLFTLAEYKKPNHYHAPNMNDWASDNPSKRTCDVGDLNILGRSFTITSSSLSSKDPFKKPLPGPR